MKQCASLLVLSIWIHNSHRKLLLQNAPHLRILLQLMVQQRLELALAVLLISGDSLSTTA